MNILVTGGAGFIGSHLVDALVYKGHKVRIADNFSSGDWKNVNPKAEVLTGDVKSNGFCHYACSGMDVVFHEAATVSVPISVQDPLGVQQNNEVATLNVLDACRACNVKRVIFAASASAYGDSDELLHEEMVPRPLSPYAVGKVTCENYLRAFSACYGIDTVSLRYFNVYGPRQRPNNGYSGVISIFIDKMKKGESPIIFGDGTQLRDFVSVEDIVRANLLALEHPNPLNGEIFNIASGNPCDINDLYGFLADAMSFKELPIYKEPRTGDVYKSIASIVKAKEILGYSPQVSSLCNGLLNLLGSLK